MPTQFEILEFIKKRYRGWFSTKDIITGMKLSSTESTHKLSKLWKYGFLERNIDHKYNTGLNISDHSYLWKIIRKVKKRKWQRKKEF